jgi:hypothetical protein
MCRLISQTIYLIYCPNTAQFELFLHEHERAIKVKQIALQWTFLQFAFIQFLPRRSLLFTSFSGVFVFVSTALVPAESLTTEL